MASACQMDIVRKVDGLDGNPVLVGASGNTTLAKWLEEASAVINPLAMPRWVQAPLEEFETELARRYFIKKKETYLGSFAKHRANSAALKAEANILLERLERLIHSPRGIHGSSLSEDDVHLFAALRILSIVKGLSYPDKVDRYRKYMSEQAKVPLFDDIAID
jgi:glutaredoxin 2